MYKIKRNVLYKIELDQDLPLPHAFTVMFFAKTWKMQLNNEMAMKKKCWVENIFWKIKKICPAKYQPLN